MQHTRLYISGQIQKICFLQFNIVIYLLIILFEEKTKNCKAPQFCKISFMVFVFYCFFLCQRQFLQGLQWVLMGVSVCSARFLVVSGGFLLWFLPQEYANIYEEQSDRASNKAFLCLCKLDCKSFLNAFGLKNRQCYLRK